MTIYALFDNSFFENKPWWMPYKLYRVVCQRANPRNKSYMLALLAEQFPTAKLVQINNIPQDATHLILLYPDAIGLGWSEVEKACLRYKHNIQVLNGRKRLFDFNSKIYNKFKYKRFLEKTMLLEFCFAPILIVAGAVLACKDKLRCS